MNGHNLRRFVVTVAGALILISKTWASEPKIPFKLDEPTAERLASEGEFGSDKDHKYFDYDSGMDKIFFVFLGVGEQSNFGFFAVNPWTGDVWSLGNCKKLTTPALRRSQVAIRKRFTAEELKQYRRLSRIEPECL